VKLFPRKKKIHKTPEGKLARILADCRVDLVLDVGANIGQSHDELRAAGYLGRMVSFEPVPSAHATLLGKAAHDSNWEIAPRMAIGATPGEAVINVSQASDMSSLREATPDLLRALPKTAVTERLATQVASLDAIWDQYCGDARVFLKIDTQGYERQVLDGVQDHLDQIVGMKLELSLFPQYAGEEDYLGFLNDLHAWGFEPLMIWDKYFSTQLGRQLQIDVVFVRRGEIPVPAD